MFVLNIINQDLFFENKNKIVIMNTKTYCEFLKGILSINNKELQQNQIKINNMVLNDKNTLVLDFSSVASYCNLLYGNNKIKDEYIKTKLENYAERDIKETLFRKELLEILEQNYGEMFSKEFVLDLDKIVKQSLNIEIKTPNDFFQIIKYLIEKSNIKQYILIYSETLARNLKIMDYINNINNSKLLKLEICSENSFINKDDNITLVQEMLYQISGNDLYNLINKEENINDEFIKKYLLSILKEKEVDENMENYKKTINKLKHVCRENLRMLNLKTFET